MRKKEGQPWKDEFKFCQKRHLTTKTFIHQDFTQYEVIEVLSYHSFLSIRGEEDKIWVAPCGKVTRQHVSYQHSALSSISESEEGGGSAGRHHHTQRPHQQHSPHPWLWQRGVREWGVIVWWTEKRGGRGWGHVRDVEKELQCSLSEMITRNCRRRHNSWPELSLPSLLVT